jgi:hypothetical protein
MNAKKLLSLPLFVVIIGGVAVYGFLQLSLFSEDQQQRNTASLVETPTTLMSPVPTPLITPYPTVTALPSAKASKWLRYEDADSGISFSYPSTALVEKEHGVLIITQWGQAQKKDTEFYDGLSVRVRVLTDAQLTAEQFIDGKMKLLEPHVDAISKKESVTIGNYKGFTFGVTAFASQRFIALNSTENINRVLEITDSTEDPGKSGFSAQAAQLISSVKF